MPPIPGPGTPDDDFIDARPGGAYAGQTELYGNGGNDEIFGDAAGGNKLVGDYADQVIDGDIIGGNDEHSVGDIDGNRLYGDNVTATSAFGDIIGGDDEITFGGGGRTNVNGDSAVASTVGANSDIIGGDDEITVGGGDSRKMYGDSATANTTGIDSDIIGGDDVISVGEGVDDNDGNKLYGDNGDARNGSPREIGGGDIIDGDDVLMGGGGGGDNMWGDTGDVTGTHIAGEDTFVFKAGETGVNTIHDFNIGGVNDEIQLVDIDEDDVSIGATGGTSTSIFISGGSGSQTIVVTNFGAPLTIGDIDFA